MKKNYIKPEISFINFKMSANIAGCGIVAEGPDREWGSMITTDENTCASLQNSNGQCYHVPTPGANLFLS